MGAIPHEEAQVPENEYGHRDMYKARANPASLMNGLFGGSPSGGGLLSFGLDDNGADDAVDVPFCFFLLFGGEFGGGHGPYERISILGKGGSHQGKVGEYASCLMA